MSHVDQVLSLLPSTRTARATRPFILGIDGRSGAGKSELAARVAAHRSDAVLVTLEEAYPGWWQLRIAADRIATGVLAPLVHGQPGHFRRYDWYRGAFAEEVVVTPAPVVILEGCGALSAPCRAYLDAAVWLAVPEARRRARAMSRDNGSWRHLWHQWAAQEAALLPERSALRHASLVLHDDDDEFSTPNGAG